MVDVVNFRERIDVLSKAAYAAKKESAKDDKATAGILIHVFCVLFDSSVTHQKKY